MRIEIQEGLKVSLENGGNGEYIRKTQKWKDNTNWKRQTLWKACIDLINLNDIYAWIEIETP